MSSLVQPAVHAWLLDGKSDPTNPIRRFPATMLGGNGITRTPVLRDDAELWLTKEIATVVAYQALGIVFWNTLMDVAIPFVSAVLVMFRSAPDVPIAPSSR